MEIQRDILKRMMGLNGGWVNRANGCLLFKLPGRVVQINAANEIVNWNVDIPCDSADLVPVPCVRLEYVFQDFLKKYAAVFKKDFETYNVIEYVKILSIPRFRDEPYTGDWKVLLSFCEAMHDMFEEREDIREMYESCDSINEIVENWVLENHVKLSR